MEHLLSSRGMIKTNINLCVGLIAYYSSKYSPLLILVLLCFATIATAEDLRKSLDTNMLTKDGLQMVSDFRFKGYVNDFMVSPRNPITLQSSHRMAGKEVVWNTLD